MYFQICVDCDPLYKMANVCDSSRFSKYEKTRKEELIIIYLYYIIFFIF